MGRGLRQGLRLGMGLWLGVLLVARLLCNLMCVWVMMLGVLQALSLLLLSVLLSVPEALLSQPAWLCGFLKVLKRALLPDRVRSCMIWQDWSTCLSVGGHFQIFTTR